MSNTIFTYPGDGVTTDWPVAFVGGYLLPEHVKAKTVLAGVETTASFTFLSEFLIQIVPAVPLGTDLVIYRDTQKDTALVDFQAGAVANEQNFDTASLQALMAVSELTDKADETASLAQTADTNAQTALANSETALADSAAAVTAANAAVANVTGAAGAALAAATAADEATAAANAANLAATTATSTAADAVTTSGNALTVANAAQATADGAVTTANGIAATANTALSTANSAEATANGIADTANSALSTANSAQADADTAISTANSATATAAAAAATAETKVAKTSDTGSAVIPAGSTAQRDGSPAPGYMRFNNTLLRMEVWNGSAWVVVGAGATGGGADTVFYENSQVVTTDYTLTAGKNAITSGPIDVAAGVTVTIPTGQSWAVV